MLNEAQGLVKEAQNIYKEIIAASPQDAHAYKRLACLLRDNGAQNEAVETLNEYLGFAMTDSSAWIELAELYTKSCSYQKALYCWEEIDLSSNFLYNLRYAECLYSCGGGENLLLARKYFSKTMMLNEKCVKAIWGLLETCRKLETVGRKYKDGKNKELMDICLKKLKGTYEGTSIPIEKLTL